MPNVVWHPLSIKATSIWCLSLLNWFAKMTEPIPAENWHQNTSATRSVEGVVILTLHRMQLTLQPDYKILTRSCGRRNVFNIAISSRPPALLADLCTIRQLFVIGILLSGYYPNHKREDVPHPEIVLLGKLSPKPVFIFAKLSS